MDELARRRKRRQHSMRTLIPPPMDGSIDQVVEDLTIVHGMTEEVLAETRALPEVPEQLHQTVVVAHDAVGLALSTAMHEQEKGG
jgi:hypothetical protein